MEIKIFRKGEETPVFVSLVTSVVGLRSILDFVKEKDEEAGITTAYEVPQLSELAKRELSKATDRYFYSQAKARGGYLNMGEIVHDAGEGDEDAQFLLKLYDAIWEKEEELEEQIETMSLEELLKIESMEAWVKPYYDAVVTEVENSLVNTDTSEG